MCGVAAVFSYHPAAPSVRREELDRMLSAQVTRGPDGEGTYEDDHHRVALGSRRLAIIAPGPDGAQPMTSADGRIVVVMNGEIYNHAELRADLLRHGVSVRSGSDTAVVLALVEMHGAAAFSRLRGMFGVIAFDKVAGVMWLARDAYGIKPLYFADDGWTLRAASQVQSLVASGAISRQIDDAAVAGFLLTGSVPEPFTLRREVSAVPAGTVVEVNRLGPSAPRSFRDVADVLRVAFGGRPHHDDAASHRALSDAVHGHRVSDVPMGLFLSGGVDSGLILAHAAARGGDAVRPVSVTFEGSSPSYLEESALAREVGERCGVAVEARTVTRDELMGDMTAILAAMDQPTIDGVNMWFASKAAREAGLKVALSGVGGDEILGGYPSFRQIPRLVHWLRPAAWLPTLGRVARAWAAPLLPARWPRKVASLLELGGTWPGAWILRRGLFMPWEVERILGVERAREAWRRLRLMSRLSALVRRGPAQDFGRVANLESCLYLRNQLLRDADWAGMAWSVEVRVPFADTWLAASMGPTLARDGSDKQRLLRTAPVPLPESVATRPKLGFHVPMETWLDHSGDGAAWRRTPWVTARDPWARRYALAVADAKGML